MPFLILWHVNGSLVLEWFWNGFSGSFSLRLGSLRQSVLVSSYFVMVGRRYLWKIFCRSSTRGLWTSDHKIILAYHLCTTYFYSASRWNETRQSLRALRTINISIVLAGYRTTYRLYIFAAFHHNLISLWSTPFLTCVHFRSTWEYKPLPQSIPAQSSKLSETLGQ